ncbi:MAG: hypothetical protein K9G58_02905 [Bacteroidales bacterium]|nr:hypothetical protein [Bacteroidales bacterium]MCF8386507.1 hypothetical protein [Bacteroidales bacterium]MCF8397089.1 hypothetical protein [Bacteroidales bacterium]
MKKIFMNQKTIIPIIATIALLFSNVTNAQEDEGSDFKTLFGNKAYSNGAYGALMINYTQIDNADAILVGAKGGWIINQAVTIGLAGYGLASDNDYTDVFENEVVNLAGGYGGLLIEPILAPRYPIHVAFPMIIGAGGIAYLDNYWNDKHDDWNSHVRASDAFFVFEPGVEIELNIVRFMRIGMATSYRYTSNISLVNSSSDLLRGFNFGVSFKFGKFWDNEQGVRYR